MDQVPSHIWSARVHILVLGTFFNHVDILPIIDQLPTHFDIGERNSFTALKKNMHILICFQ